MVFSLKMLVICAMGFHMGSASAATIFNKPLGYRYFDCDSTPLSFSFPFIESDNKLIAKRINNYLHFRYLELAPPEKHKTTPIYIPKDGLGGWGLREVESKELVFNNEGRVLTVQVFSDSCGAYKSAGTSSFSFDTRTGQYIYVEDLLTPSGVRDLARYVFKERQAKIKKEIRRLEGLLVSKKQLANHDIISSSIELYRQCLDNRFKENSLRRGDEFPGVSQLGDGFILFGMAECFSQADAPFDDLGAFENRISAEALKPYLSNYGKYIILGEGNYSGPEINPYGQLFFGMINGNIPITIFLKISSPSSGAKLFAQYYYDKYRTVINLSVEKKGDLYELTEINSKEIPKPVLSVRIEGNRLVGQWRGAGKAYSFEATP